ncbi:MAG TPA: AMP-binding protein [Kofleriaceae bacterium]|nr:AMP-binding protein [Kofleriaceae bacterium]
MRIVAVEHRLVRWTIAPTGPARGLTTRESVIVAVRDDAGHIGLGEAAPLPAAASMSVDTIADALAAVDALASRLPVTIDSPGHASALADRIAAAPAARFAIECALLAALAQRRGTSVAALLAGTPHAELESAVVVDDEFEAAHASARGARCLKVKVGNNVADVERVRRIARAAPSCRLRLDANRAWSRGEAIEKLAGFRGLPIEYVEEPCVNSHELLGEPLPCKIALDESLVELAPVDVERAVRSPRLAALVLKPTLLGGFARCMELAALAHRHGVAPIVTHALEGPIGFAACGELARAIGADVPVGLAPYAIREVPNASRDARANAGVARGTGAAPARYRVLVATHTDATVDAIREAWQRKETLALLHAKASDVEQARQRRLLDEAARRGDLRDGDAFVLFTSGSTGPSRGVVHTRDSVMAAARASEANLGWRDDDAWLCCLPLAHAGGLSIVMRCLLANKRVILADDPREIADATLASLVPAQLAALLEDPAWRPSRRLRAVLLGGAAAPRPLVDAAVARGVPVLPTYGLTETFGQVATAREPGGVARLLDGVSIDARHDGGLRAVRTAPALLRVRGPMLARAYLDGVPIAPELVTADLGFVQRDSDGDAVHVVGRADDVIISGGENVHPTQVEAVLAATPGVREAAAFGVPDPRWGQIVAVAIAADDRFDREGALARWYAALPAHARPRRIVTLAELPRLPSGKLDRRSVAQLPTIAVEYAG